MSLLNLTSDGFPNVLVVLCGAIIAGKTQEAQLIDSCAPSGLVEDASKASTTLRRWREFGLFQLDDGHYRFGSHFSHKLKGDQYGLIGAVRRAATQCALAASNNENFWAREGAGTADLTRSLAWMLAQDVYRTTSVKFEDLESKQLPKEKELYLLKNASRLTGLRRWAHFLGFVRDANSDIIDPTLAIEDRLPVMFPAEALIPAAEFVDRLAAELPVLDHGQYRLKLQSELLPVVIALPKEGEISSALSRALWCLEAKGRIQLVSRADAGSGVTPIGAEGPRVDRRFTHVRVMPGEPQ